MTPLDRDAEHAAAALQPNLPEVVGERQQSGVEAVKDRDVACPACLAAAGEPCTQATESGRRKVSWTHSARHDLRTGWSVGQ